MCEAWKDDERNRGNNYMSLSLSLSGFLESAGSECTREPKNNTNCLTKGNSINHTANQRLKYYKQVDRSCGLLSSGLDRTCVPKLCTLGRHYAQIAARHRASGADLLEANSRRKQTADWKELQAEDNFLRTVCRKKEHEPGFHPAVSGSCCWIV